MACIGTESNGHRRILFVAADGARKTVRLGKCSQHDAEQVCRHVEALAASTIHGQSVSRVTALWISNVGRTLHDRLSRAGLIEPRQHAGRMTVAEFIDGYIAQRHDLKPTTLTVLKQARIWLVRYLGENRRLDAVKVADADGYQAHMFASGLAKATIAKRCRYARHYFEVAKRRGNIDVNPFAHIKGAVKGDVTRRVFVPEEVVQKVIDGIPDAQWKLLIALARWGGLRIPSEALALTWADVDFAGKRFIVRATKTAHHEDGGIRVVPMFPELADLFQKVFDEAEDGAVHVISRYRSGGVNLRTQLLRYINRAGLKPWPKLWQNLRASRATELADKFPSHVCAAWLGHTEKVADAFYRTVTDSHFERATSAAQNPAQQMHAERRNERQDENPKRKNPANCGAFPEIATGCENSNKNLVGVAGLEPATSSV